MPADKKPVSSDNADGSTEMRPVAAPAHLEPVSRRERVAAVDVVRGFAILGILMVNMPVFNSPFFYFLANIEMWSDAIDKGTIWLVRFAAESKFYSMFSFLFGLGFCIQMDRAHEKGGSFGAVYGRRLLVLLVVGQIHAHFVWMGDILTFYAILALVLLLFRKRAPRTLLIWAVFLLLLPFVFNAVMTVFVEVGKNIPEAREQIEEGFAKQNAEFERRGDRALEIYAKSSWSEIVTLRREELFSMYTFALFLLVPNILAMFLVGLYVGRRGIHSNIEDHLPLIRRVALWGVVLGLIGNAVYTYAMATGNPAVPSLTMLAGSAGIMVGAPALCFAYVCGLTLLVRSERWKQRLAPIGAVGRMALTNYLMQSVICTLIFYSYGLGLYGACPPFWGLMLTFAIYLFQIALSVWWLGRFRFGPLEWLWRSLTYAEIQPLRLARGEGT